MADYWKSQARKYCDFCKCWIADNKPSIEFHEKGRRHQDNVAKKLKFISKKSRRDEKELVKTESILKQIESAALEAYRKDVQNNGDLTSVAINNKIQRENSKKQWKELRNENGKLCYRNVLTNETVFESPEEGYLSLAEQRELLDDVTRHQLKLVNKQRILDARILKEETKKEDAEARAAAAREKMKERRVSPEPIPTVSGPILEPGKTEPYGKWQKVETSTASIDLQLPKQDYEYYEVPVAQERELPPPREFKERTVDSLGSGKATFKKRKFMSGAKKNTRQRTNDD